MKQNILTIQENTIIFLGYVGDESSTLIRIPVATFISRYGGGGNFELIHRPPGAECGHTVLGISVVDDFVEWLVGSEELSTYGRGEVQLMYICQDGVAHTKIWESVIMRSLSDTADIPEPWVPWVQKLYEYKEDAENAASHYPYIDEDTNHWIVWDTTINDWKDTGVSALGVSDYEGLTNKPQINGVELSGNMTLSDIKAVYDDTTANWNIQYDFIPMAGSIIIYSDYASVDGVNVPNIKIGDGLAYLVDLPFVSDDLRQIITSHISNNVMHVTAAEKDFWNNKVTCYVELIEGNDYLIHFSKD